MGSWCNNVSVKKIALGNGGNKELPLTGRDLCRFFLINGEPVTELLTQYQSGLNKPSGNICFAPQ